MNKYRERQLISRQNIKNNKSCTRNAREKRYTSVGRVSRFRCGSRSVRNRLNLQKHCFCRYIYIYKKKKKQKKKNSFFSARYFPRLPFAARTKHSGYVYGQTAGDRRLRARSRLPIGRKPFPRLASVTSALSPSYVHSRDQGRFREWGGGRFASVWTATLLRVHYCVSPFMFAHARTPVGVQEEPMLLYRFRVDPQVGWNRVSFTCRGTAVFRTRFAGQCELGANPRAATSS